MMPAPAEGDEVEGDEVEDDDVEDDDVEDDDVEDDVPAQASAVNLAARKSAERRTGERERQLRQSVVANDGANFWGFAEDMSESEPEPEVAPAAAAPVPVAKRSVDKSDSNGGFTELLKELDYYDLEEWTKAGKGKARIEFLDGKRKRKVAFGKFTLGRPKAFLNALGNTVEAFLNEADPPQPRPAPPARARPRPIHLLPAPQQVPRIHTAMHHGHARWSRPLDTVVGRGRAGVS